MNNTTTTSSYSLERSLDVMRDFRIKYPNPPVDVFVTSEEVYNLLKKHLASESYSQSIQCQLPSIAGIPLEVCTSPDTALVRGMQLKDRGKNVRVLILRLGDKDSCVALH